ncbi:MAG: sodium:solute symporter family protein [Verrucomicrobiales bacterium]|nr:sodium:solute symporter family protein [Verrucomicrobiales bacterium]
MTGDFPAVCLAAAGMQTIPIVMLACYMLMLLVLGYIGFRRSKTTEEDYYLAGRGQRLIVTVLTIMATMFSSAAMLGIPGLIYKDGIGFLLFAMNLPLSGAAVYVLGSRIWRAGRKRGYVTPGDMLSDYYGGSRGVRILAAVTGFLYVIPYIVMQIKAGGHLAQVLFPGTENAFQIGATALSIVTMLYVLIGGMRSVAWTDVIQGSLLLSGMLIAGIATVTAMGGIGGFFEKVNTLPEEALTLPGPSNAWSPWKMLTICLFASLGTMIQPGQWMRYYSAHSANTLRRSSLIFSIVLPICFLFGVMLVALGGRVLFPPDLAADQPHELVKSFDQILVVMMKEHIPQLLGALGPFVVSLLFVAILAASMSTADSNLHSLSAVLTRDIYDRFIRPKSSERERAWVGRSIIVVATFLALGLVQFGERNPDFEPLKLIAEMMLFAIAFSCQLLPVTFDMLFFRRGTKAGAIAGISAGLLTVLAVLIFTKIVGEPVSGLANLSRLLDTGFTGCAVNAIVFVAVSAVTKKLPTNHVETFARDFESDE